ncbi:TrmH family RNA methyltransferase [Dokdonia sp. Hel_I_53]|uniref:TrmH family RNA methyltransferase n=1 Tax=Dokdonia sp. Hel_I_53 TaxID=1566287 RepID=UPI001198FC65|nr:RNA methyltransferase [Dokdonia sp. Hel_I_53]TVZ51513.1 tRNA (guanosine-2'-O-)-methyltransferase [Dokdonia sp. Hel_I_53]
MNQQLLDHLQEFLTPRRKMLFDRVIPMRTRHITVAVEDVYQLHNTSAVIRSCESFGIQDVHVIEEVNSKRIDREIAMGAQKWVDVHRHTSTKNCIHNLREQGYKIAATTPHKKAQTLQDFSVNQKTAIFFGRETEGLSDLVLDEADDFIYIPMVGFTESLNISVSAAITLQHLMDDLRKSKINWRLSPTAQFELKLEWTRKMIKDIEHIEARYLNTLENK